MTHDQAQISGRARCDRCIMRNASLRVEKLAAANVCTRNLADCAKLSTRIGESRAAFERTEAWWDNDEKAPPRAHLEKDSM